MVVTLGLVFVASLRKEWPMTFIAGRCPHCQRDQSVNRGKMARGTQRDLCQHALCAQGHSISALEYLNRHVKDMLSYGTLSWGMRYYCTRLI
jgi:hypothetical protein